MFLPLAELHAGEIAMALTLCVTLPLIAVISSLMLKITTTMEQVDDKIEGIRDALEAATSRYQSTDSSDEFEELDTSA